jgi:hypothetical protein
MDSSPTLHDFVLNLLCDATARSAFELDPEGALQAAGLGDITAADVQEVIPLVVDYAPVEGITALAPVDQLGTGVPELDVAGAVQHLQAITQQVALSAVPTLDVNAAAASAVTVTGGGLLPEPLLPVAGLGLGGLGLGGISTLPAGASADLSVDSDPAASLDTELVSPVGESVTGVVAGTDQIVGGTAVGGAFGTLDVAVNAVTGLTPANDLLDPLQLDEGPLLPATSSVVGSVVGPDSAVGGVVDVDGTLHGVGDTVTGVGGLVGLGQSASPATGHATDDVTDLLF